MARFSALDSADKITDSLKSEGYVIIENVLSPDQITRLDEQITPHIDSAYNSGGADDPLGADTITFLGAILAKAPVVGEIIINPLVNKVVESTLAYKSRTWSGDKLVEHNTNVQLSDATVITVYPGGAAQGLHRDDQAHHRVHPGPESQVTAIYAMSRFTEENGATRILPRSHMYEEDRMPRPEETIAAEMAVGSVALILGGTYHGGGANTVSDRRSGLVIVYAHGHLRQVENMWLTVPIDIVKQYPPEVQRLLGWDFCEPYLGHYAFQSPRVLLEDHPEGTPSGAKEAGAEKVQA